MTQILIIEDEEILSEHIAAILGFEGYDVLVARNGRLGIELAQEHLPDLIMCDVSMPELDGYAVLSELRQTPTTMIIPFVFLTAHSDKAFMRHAMALGADDYLTKPFTQDDLLEAIRARLDRSMSIARSYDDHLEGAKAALTRMVAHELRTPLISLRTNKDILQRKRDELTPDIMNDFLDSMDTSIERLTHVVEQTIYLTHLETGLLRYDTIQENGTAVPIDSILRGAIGLGRQYAYRHRYGEVQSHMSDPDALIMAHPQALKHALAELVTNALCFSDDHDDVQIEQMVAGSEIFVRIIDCGMGIPPASHATALDKFTQVDRAKQEQQGMGLGLHVARRIVEAHGGALEIASGSPQGTEVTVRLPLLSRYSETLGHIL
jgi:signal transduction histidine kinase